MNLVSHRNLSVVRENSHNTSDSESPVSGRTDQMHNSFGKPSQKSTDDLHLHSRKRPQWITSGIGSEHSDENVSSHRENVARNTDMRKENQTRISWHSGYEYRVHEQGLFTTFRLSWQKYRIYQYLHWKHTRPTCWCGVGFLISSMTAAIHLSPEHIEYLAMSQNSEFNNIESLLSVTKTLIADNQEVRNVSCFDCDIPSWTRFTLPNDRAVQLTKAKVCVHSESVLYLGENYTTREAIEQWKGQVATFSSGKFFQWAIGTGWRTNCIRVEKFTRIYSIFSTKFNAIWRILTLNQNNSEVESFLSMFSDTDIYKRGYEDACTST